ncbi:MAG: S8 family peptidase, partial [Lachnospiraceae bacterium]|nr:S8 family peptidase [Lachnospiraceae bacterium]
IITENQNELNDVEKEFKDEKVESTTEYLEDNNMMIIELEDGDKDTFLEENKELNVEEDVIVMANGKKNKKGFFDFFKRKKSKKQIGREWNMDMVKDTKDDKSLKTVKVAIIDSGIDEFATNIPVKERKNFIPGQEEVAALLEDVTGHGTSIASILTSNGEDGQIEGISNNIELYSAKVLDSGNSAPVSRIIEAIYWAIEKKVNIISLSFGTPNYSQALENAVKEAYDNGILIIAAAGNEGEDGVQYPAAFKEVLAVGSVDSDANISDFSSTGEEVEIVAPGERIKATGSFDGSIIVSGTSIAVPHVVGAAATIWGKDLSKSNEFVRQLIDVSANEVGKFDEYGNGIVDISYALEIYDDFSEKFEEGNKFVNEEVDYEITGNENEVYEYKNDYVEGKWTESTHNKLIDEKDIYLNTNQIWVLKRASELADSAYYLKKAGVRPSLHGFYRKKATYQKTEDGEVLATPYYQYDQGEVIPYNYVAAYIYLTRCGIKGDYRNVSLDSFKCVSAHNAVKNASDAFTKAGFYNDAEDVENRRQIWIENFVGKGHKEAIFKAGKSEENLETWKTLYWGFALHTMTDVYAHSTYTINDETGEWYLLDHKKLIFPEADNEKRVETRLEWAREKAYKVIWRYVTRNEGKPADFEIEFDSSEPLKIAELLRYCQDAGGLPGSSAAKVSSYSRHDGKLYYPTPETSHKYSIYGINGNKYKGKFWDPIY